MLKAVPHPRAASVEERPLTGVCWIAKTPSFRVCASFSTTTKTVSYADAHWHSHHCRCCRRDCGVRVCVVDDADCDRCRGDCVCCCGAGVDDYECSSLRHCRCSSTANVGFV